MLYVYIIFRLFSVVGYYKMLDIVPAPYSKSLLLLCFMYSSFCLLILNF